MAGKAKDKGDDKKQEQNDHDRENRGFIAIASRGVKNATSCLFGVIQNVGDCEFTAVRRNDSKRLDGLGNFVCLTLRLIRRLGIAAAGAMPCALL